jgi:hypothetical protein
MSRRPTALARAAGRLFSALALGALAGCAGPSERALAPPAVPSWAVAEAHVVSVRAGMECVTYARRQSNIELFGDAWTWWDEARGRYARGAAPRPGAVLVFKRYHGSPGHLAVVRRVIGPRLIVVDHADWLNDGKIYLAMPVADVSPGGDWSELRVWYPPGIAWGLRVYGAYGFIYPGSSVAATMGPSQDRG